MEPTFRSVSQTDERFTHKAAPRVLRSADESTPDAAREGVRWWSSAHGAMPGLQSIGRVYFLVGTCYDSEMRARKVDISQEE